MSNLYIVGEATVIPSMICIMPSDEIVICPTAYQKAKAKEVGVNFLAPLIDSDRHYKITDVNYKYLKLFLSKTYDTIKSNPNNPLHTSIYGKNDFVVYLSCPSGWNQEQIDAYKEFAKKECNIPVIDAIKKSHAAYIAGHHRTTGGFRAQGGNVLVIDFGSNTIDFTYFNSVRCSKPVFEEYKLGARMVEEFFLQYLKEHEPEANENILLVKKICGVEKGENILLSAIKVLKEAYFMSQDQNNFLLSIDLKRLLLDKSLSGRYIEPASGEGYSKQEVLDILSDYRSKLAYMLDDFLTKDGVTSVDKVIFIGGASRMFFFKDLIAEKYKVSKDNGTLFVDLDPNFTIPHGIAALGYMNEKRAHFSFRDEYSC